MHTTGWLRSFYRRIRSTKKWKLILGAASLVFVFLVGFAFVSGPLFPWSPVKIGYDCKEFKRASVIFPNGTTFPNDCLDIDNIMDDVERFHGLKFEDRVKIIFCDTWGLFHRGRLCSFGFRSEGPLASAIGTGTVIYFSPGLKNSGRNLRGLLKHELSHAIRYQHMALGDVLGPYGNLHWLDEGIAIHYGNASDYPKAKEFRTMAIEKGYLFRVTDKRDADKIPLSIRHMFRYAEYNFFFTYLINRFGRDSVMEYVKATMKSPDQSELHFRTLFRASLLEVVSSFEQAVLNGEWPIEK